MKILWLILSNNKQILYSSSRESQEAALSKTIELAKALKKMKNFEGMAAVTSVFGNATIQRLKPLWASLKKKVSVNKILIVVEEIKVDQYLHNYNLGLGRFTKASEYS
jgi:hypothetical protein